VGRYPHPANLAVLPKQEKRFAIPQSIQPQVPAFYRFVEKAASSHHKLPGTENNQEFSLRDSMVERFSYHKGLNFHVLSNTSGWNAYFIL
jgi:hypothetical protein